MNEKIFIPISACNEKDLKQTVLSCINNACNPDRLYFGIYEHSLTNNFCDFSDLTQEIIHLKLKYDAPLGPGLPRLNASTLTVPDKDFLFQIDAHMIFEKNWDTDLIKYYSTISKVFNKPIISTYTPWWYEDELGNIKLSADQNYVVDVNNFEGLPNIKNGKLKLEDFNISLYRNYLGLTGENVFWNKNKIYEQHYFLSGHFLFTSFDYVFDIPHDPFIVWAGDEVVSALRSWTRGYKMFTIDKPIAWHKNKWGPTTTGIGTKSLDKTDWRIAENSKNKYLYTLYTKKLNKSFRRIKDIMLGDYIGEWGSPTQDLLKEYEDVIGVKFNDYYSLLKTDLQNTNKIELYKILYE